MKIELGVLSDGNVMMVSDRPLPDIVRRVEYYREQRLFMLVFEDPAREDELMHYEIPEEISRPVEATPNIIIYSLFPEREPIGYKVPLVKVGGLY